MVSCIMVVSLCVFPSFIAALFHLRSASCRDRFVLQLVSEKASKLKTPHDRGWAAWPCCQPGHNPRIGCRRRLLRVSHAGLERFMSEQFSFGAWVRQRRRALDLTLRELAAQIGCAAVTIRHIETGKGRPSKQLAARLADGLHVSAEERGAFLQAARGDLAADRLGAPAVSRER